MNSFRTGICEDLDAISAGKKVLLDSIERSRNEKKIAKDKMRALKKAEKFATSYKTPWKPASNEERQMTIDSSPSLTFERNGITRGIYGIKSIAPLHGSQPVDKPRWSNPGVGLSGVFSCGEPFSSANREEDRKENECPIPWAYNRLCPGEINAHPIYVDGVYGVRHDAVKRASQPARTIEGSHHNFVCGRPKTRWIHPTRKSLSDDTQILKEIFEHPRRAGFRIHSEFESLRD